MTQMRASKLIYLLQLLNRGEQLKFRRYIHSPYFVKKREYGELYRMALKIATTKYKDCTEAEMFAQMKHKPGKTFDQNWFRKTKTELTILLLDFLSQQEYEREAGRKEIYLLRALNRRGGEKYFSMYADEAERAVATHHYYDVQHYNLSLEVEYEQIVYSNGFAYDRKAGYVQKSLWNMHHRHLLEKLRYALEALMIEIINEDKITVPGLSHTLGYIENNFKTLPKPVQVYYRLYSSFADKKNSEMHYTSAKKVLLPNWNVFNRKEQHNLIRYLINYNTDKSNNFKSKEKELFIWYQHLIGKGFLLHNKKLIPILFQDIVAVACYLKRFKWANTFLSRYGKHLLETGNAVAYQYIKGIIRFSEKEFQPAKELFALTANHINKPLYCIQAKAFILMCHYELEEFMAAEDVCFSFAIFLEKEKNLSVKKKRPYHLMAKLLSKLLALRAKPSQSRLEKLRHKIMESPLREFAKSWLLSKTEELVIVHKNK